MTKWIAEQLKDSVAPETTKGAVPVIAAVGTGAASLLLGNHLFGNSMLGLAGGVGGAGALSYFAYKAFGVDDTKGKRRDLVTPTRNQVAPLKKVRTAELGGNGEVVPRNTLVTTFNRTEGVNRTLGSTVPLRIDWDKIKKVELHEIATDKPTEGTAHIIQLYQQWEESTRGRSIRDRIDLYNGSTRRELKGQLGSFGLSDDDINITGIVPATLVRPPLLSIGSNALSTDLNKIGEELRQINYNRWLELNPSQKLNRIVGHIRYHEKHPDSPFTKIKLTPSYTFLGIDTGPGLTGVGFLRDVDTGLEHKVRVALIESLKKDPNKPRLPVDLAIQVKRSIDSKANAGSLGSRRGQVEHGAQTLLAIAAIEPLEEFDLRYHQPHRIKLVEYAKKDGALDKHNKKVDNLKPAFERVAVSFNTQRIVVLEHVEDAKWPAYPGQGYVTLKDLRTWEGFGHPETAFTRTIGFKKEGSTYVITGWKLGANVDTGWTKPAAGAPPITIANPNDPAQVKALLDKIVPTNQPKVMASPAVVAATAPRLSVTIPFRTGAHPDSGQVTILDNTTLPPISRTFTFLKTGEKWRLLDGRITGSDNYNYPKATDGVSYEITDPNDLSQLQSMLNAIKGNSKVKARFATATDISTLAPIASTVMPASVSGSKQNEKVHDGALSGVDLATSVATLSPSLPVPLNSSAHNIGHNDPLPPATTAPQLSGKDQVGNTEPSSVRI